MNYKNIMLLVCLAMFAINQAQITKGEVIYEALINVNNIKKLNDSISKSISNDVREEVSVRMQKVIESAKNVSYTLSFNLEESLFIRNDKMKNDKEFEPNITLSLAGKGIFYTNSKINEIIEQKEAYGETFLVNYPSVKWSLTKDIKQIGDFMCYKATGTVKIEGSYGIKYKPIIAWYSPKISINFGPNKFSGLPGLILELKVGKLHTFLAKEINLNPKKNIVIKKPTRGKKITREELDAIGKKIRQQERGN